MGNLWIAHFDSSSSSPSSTRPSSPGLTKSTNNEGTHSGTGSAFSSSLDEVSPNGQILPITPTLKIFSFAELKKATRNFRPDAVVGEGCFGTVFKGWIDEKTFAPTKAWSGMAIAVKKLNSDGLQGRKEWQSEVNILGSLSHPNIVILLGLCEEDRELLVYEFIPSGSLANHLFSRGSAFQTLSWSIRLKIAIGVARGLAFLHCSERKIIHRNLTPSNVLIDSNYNPKISDFRLARDGPPLGGNSHVTIRVMGTYGYLAPEYVATGRLYVKSDVYSFGVVLLELLSGRRALDPKRPSGQHILAEWARPYLSDPRNVLLLVMDQRLEGQYPSEGAVQAAQLILMCLGYEPRRRPSMSEVVETLEQIQAIRHKAQEPKNNPRRPTDQNHADHHAHFSTWKMHDHFKKSRSNYTISYF